MSIADRISEWLPIAWFLAGALVLLTLWATGTLDHLFKRLTKFDGFGLSFEFTEKSAQETRTSVEESLGAIRTAIQRKVAADVRTYGLQEAFQTVLEATELKDKKGIRATVHIPDPLYRNQLFQLLDYYPKGGGAGRTFSTRSGIIGMAWRNRKSDSWHQGRSITQTELRRQWGMTEKEAEERLSADRSKLFLAFPLLDPTGAVPIGVFYLDANDRAALGLRRDPDTDTDGAKAEADDYLARIEEQITTQFKAKMSARLTSVVETAKKESPQLSLEGQ